MKHKLPPLAWFRAFEAAARHQSMTAAAQELGLTQPAISQQIQLLEHRFDMQLFNRQPKGLVLTDAGRLLLPQVEESIRGLARLISEYDTQQEEEVLTVAVSASFARSFVAPIMPLFYDRFPEAQIRIRTTLWPDDFVRSDAEVEIRFGAAASIGKGVQSLGQGSIVAVCAADYFSGKPDWDEVRQARLIQTVGASETWESWAHGLGFSQPFGKAQFVDAHGLAIDMALHGIGIALTSLLLAAPYLQSGQLVMPVAAHRAAKENYFVTMKKDTPNKYASNFVELIKGEIQSRMELAAQFVH